MSSEHDKPPDGPAADKPAAPHRAASLSGKLHDLEVRIGESLSHLPVVPKSRKSRVLVRSIIIGFILVFGWIAGIVFFQLRKSSKPDFRPQAEQILIALRDGKAAQVYAEASPRFQEVVLEERFLDEMAEMQRTMGRFIEITAVTETEVVRGPGGRTGRVDLQLAYEHGLTRGNVSFHWDEGRWKLLGVSIEMPEEVARVEGTQAKREARVKAPPELRSQVESILALLRDGKSDQVWSEAAPVFQSSESKAELRQLEELRREVLGIFRRILDVTSSQQNPSQTSASLDVLLEYERSVVTATFGFTRVESAWKLGSYKLVLPMPRAPAPPGRESP